MSSAIVHPQASRDLDVGICEGLYQLEFNEGFGIFGGLTKLKICWSYPAGFEWPCIAGF